MNPLEAELGVHYLIRLHELYLVLAITAGSQVSAIYENLVIGTKTGRHIYFSG